jgi:hypothetical protein
MSFRDDPGRQWRADSWFQVLTPTALEVEAAGYKGAGADGTRFCKLVWLFSTRFIVLPFAEEDVDDVNKASDNELETTWQVMTHDGFKQMALVLQ